MVINGTAQATEVLRASTKPSRNFFMLCKAFFSVAPQERSVVKIGSKSLFMAMQ
jgi:hypothetical protein